MSSSSDGRDTRPAGRGGPYLNVASPSGSKAGPSLSRFIPREELGSFTAWQPGALTGSERRSEERRHEDRGTADRRTGAANVAPNGASNPASNAAPGNQPASRPFSAGSSAAGPAGAGGARPAAAAAAAAVPGPTAAEWQARVTAARQAGYQDGYRDGLVALDGFKQSFAQQNTAQIGALLSAFDEQLQALDGVMAQAVARTALLLAQQVLRSEVQQRPELVAEVARQAINTVMHSARQVTVHVHPQDLPLVSQGAEEVLSARGARLRADSSISRGGVFVNSDVGSVDARLDTRWAEAVAAFGVAPLPYDHSPPATAHTASAVAAPAGADASDRSGSRTGSRFGIGIGIGTGTDAGSGTDTEAGADSSSAEAP